MISLENWKAEQKVTSYGFGYQKLEVTFLVLNKIVVEIEISQ